MNDLERAWGPSLIKKKAVIDGYRKLRVSYSSDKGVYFLTFKVLLKDYTYLHNLISHAERLEKGAAQVISLIYKRTRDTAGLVVVQNGKPLVRRSDGDLAVALTVTMAGNKDGTFPVLPVMEEIAKSKQFDFEYF